MASVTAAERRDGLPAIQTPATGGADWEPCWLGPPARRLYAALHRASAPASIGAVLAPPLLAEQPRSRRLLTEIADALAAQGLPCLRFDYFGTGDSAGAGEAHDVAAMRADLDTAVAALRERTGVARVALLAWRGAALPARVWAAQGSGIDVLVLWEPVTDGAAWLAELEAADRAERISRDRYPHGAGAVGVSADEQLLGFPVSAAWRSGIGALRLADSGPDAHTAVWGILRDATDAGATPAWAQRAFALPADTPRFDGATSMDATLFLSRPLRGLVRELGSALLEKRKD